MNQQIFKYLKEYNQDTTLVNRLLVSTFIFFKEIQVYKNLEVKKLIISKEDKEEYQYLHEFILLIKKVDNDFCFEELLELFEFVISPSDKLVNGAIYTPKDIRKYIIKTCFSKCKKNIENLRIADISCGCGGFLIDVSKALKNKTNKPYKSIYSDNIFGVDIQKYSIERTKILLSLLAIESGEDEDFSFNLYEQDSLEFDWKEENSKIKDNDGFDIVVGNPPYVCSRNMDDKTKSLMSKWSTCTTGHPDLYIPFFEIGHRLLNSNGILGYITVNSFIKSLNGRAIRKYFQDKKVHLSILDFQHEQIFSSRMTYTSICFLINKPSDALYYKPITRDALKIKIKLEKILYKDLSIHNGWYLTNRSLVQKIESTGTKFGEIYSTKSGIATLKNKIYIFKPLKEDDEYYFINEETKIEKSICKNIVNSNLLVKTNKIDGLIEKIIFPYDYDEYDKVYTMTENKIKEDYPFAYQYLLDNKDDLATRDKGKGKEYTHWYAFGRNQSLDKVKNKLLFPQMAKEGFQSCITTDENLYFYNGMGAMSENINDLELLEKIFMTKIFWTYVSSISKPYSSNYFSLGRNYIKYFGIYTFSNKDKQYILREENTDKVNSFIDNKYF